MTEVAIRVQHHPARAHLLPKLLGRLASAEVVHDPHPDWPPSAWRTYRACLERPWPFGATHLLVIQDDAEPCEHLREGAALLARKDPVALFLAGAPARTARRAKALGRPGMVEVAHGDWVPVVALLWPHKAAQEFLEWAQWTNVPNGRRPMSDDAIVGRWARQSRRKVWAATPSLVDHPDSVPSLIRGRQMKNENPWRRAHQFIGERDPRDLDWG